MIWDEELTRKTPDRRVGVERPAPAIAPALQSDARVLALRSGGILATILLASLRNDQTMAIRGWPRRSETKDGNMTTSLGARAGS